VVTTFDTFGDTNLILPLSWGNFGVKTSELNSGIETSSKVSFSDGSSEYGEVTDTTVVSSLRVRESTSGPSKGPSVGGTSSNEEEIFLFDTEPGIMGLGSIHNLVG